MTQGKTTFDQYPDTIDHYAIEREARRLRAEAISTFFAALVARLSRRTAAQAGGRTV